MLASRLCFGQEKQTVLLLSLICPPLYPCRYEDGCRHSMSGEGRTDCAGCVVTLSLGDTREQSLYYTQLMGQ